MSSLKLKHSGGNGVIIAAPSSNPASDRTLTVPSNADGTILTNSTPGCILQVVQGYKNDIFSSTSNSYVDITGLNLTITPASSSNKILIRYDVILSGQSWTKGVTQIGLSFSSDGGSSFSLIGAGTGGNLNTNTIQQLYSNTDSNTEASVSTVSLSYLHSPNSTAALQYKLVGRIESSNGNWKVNAQSHNKNGSSSITAMEVAA